ncbi:MAG: hypothetical protein WA633_10045, partial [Stellaceae bacterium]
MVPIPPGSTEYKVAAEALRRHGELPSDPTAQCLLPNHRWRHDTLSGLELTTQAPSRSIKHR